MISERQVLARVAVQRGQQLVEVDVGLRLADRDRAVLGQPAGGLRARVELDGHVLEPRLGPQEHRRVLVDADVGVVELEPEHGLAVVELHAGDLRRP